MSQIILQDFATALLKMGEVCVQADEDCPSEYRSKHFNPSIQDAYDFIDAMVEKHKLEDTLADVRENGLYRN
mgnify:FL=1